MVAQVERHERDPRFHQPARQERLLAPEVLAVAVAAASGSCSRSNAAGRSAADQKLDGLLLELVEASTPPASGRDAAEPIEVRKQRRAILEPLLGQARGQREEVGLRGLARVDPDIGVDRGAGSPRWR